MSEHACMDQGWAAVCDDRMHESLCDWLFIITLLTQWDDGPGPDLRHESMMAPSPPYPIFSFPSRHRLPSGLLFSSFVYFYPSPGPPLSSHPKSKECHLSRPLTKAVRFAAQTSGTCLSRSCHQSFLSSDVNS